MICAALRLSLGFSLFAVLLSALPTIASAQNTRIEAQLLGSESAPLASGRAKFEQRPNHTKFSVDAKGLQSYDGQTVRIIVNFEEVGTVVVKKGKINLKLDARKGDTVPTVNPGDTVRVVVGDGEVEITLLEGQFPSDGGGGVA
jgi:hypothetical protein